MLLHTRPDLLLHWALFLAEQRADRALSTADLPTLLTAEREKVRLQESIRQFWSSSTVVEDA